MSIQSDIVTALANVCGGRVYPFGEVPEDAALPLVVFRRTTLNRIPVLGGYSGLSISEFIFECWGEKSDTASAKAVALSTADAVRSAIAAATAITSKWDTVISGEDYDAETLEEMEPVGFGFAHT